MTEIDLKKEEIDLFFDMQPTLSGVIHSLEDKFKIQGLVICEVWINNMKLSIEQESAYAKTSREQVESMKIVLDELSALVLDSIVSTVESFQKLKAESLTLSEVLRVQSATENHQRISDLIRSAEFIVEMLKALRGHLKFDLEQWQEAESGLLNCVQELYTAYEKKSDVLMADVLEYEWSNAIDVWLQVLEQIGTSEGDGTDQGRPLQNP